MTQGADAGALWCPTWYDDTAVDPPPALTAAPRDRGFDVAVIGGGLAGLVMLLELARRGMDAVLLDARRIGSGASGRNGGFCTPGWAAGEGQIRRLVGPAHARALAEMAEEGLDWMEQRAGRPDYPGVRPVRGALTLSLSGRPPARPPAGDRVIAGGELSALLSAGRYRWGLVHGRGFHFHPLNFMRALAREAQGAGGLIVENTPLAGFRRDGKGFVLTTTGGAGLTARRLVLATGGYLGTEEPRLRRTFLPIRTYIGVTDPMPALLDRHIRSDAAIADTRRAGNYYRRLHDGRLLWGMAITAFGTLEPGRIRRMVRRDLAGIYPGLAAEMRDAGIGLPRVWAGNMAYARHFMPFVGQLEPGLFAIIGFGGHGMNTAPAAARALAAFIAGEEDRLAPFRAIPLRPVHGLAGRLAAEASYRLRQTADRLAEWLG